MRTREKIGFLLMMLGILTADSEMLIIPLALLGAGVVLMRRLVEW